DVHSPAAGIGGVPGEADFQCARTGPPAEADALHQTVHPGAEPDRLLRARRPQSAVVMSYGSVTLVPAFRVRPTVHTLSMARCTVTSSRSRASGSSSLRSSSKTSSSCG